MCMCVCVFYFVPLRIQVVVDDLGLPLLPCEGPERERERGGGGGGRERRRCRQRTGDERTPLPCREITHMGSLLLNFSTFGRLEALFTSTVRDISAVRTQVPASHTDNGSAPRSAARTRTLQLPRKRSGRKGLSGGYHVTPEPSVSRARKREGRDSTLDFAFQANQSACS